MFKYFPKDVLLLFADIKTNLNSFLDVFFFIFFLFISSFFISIQIFLSFIFLFFYLFWFIIVCFLSAILKKKFIIQINKYYFNLKNIFLVFFKSFFFDIPKKWAFFYFYKIIDFFKNFELNRHEKKLNLDIIKFIFINIIVKYTIFLITSFTFFVVKTTNDVFIKYKNLNQFKYKTYLIFLSNFVFDIIVTYNNNINNLIKGCKIIIFNKTILLNPKQFKFLKNLNNIDSVYKIITDKASNLKEPHLFHSGLATFSRSVVTAKTEILGQSVLATGYYTHDNKFICLGYINTNDLDVESYNNYNKYIWKKSEISQKLSERNFILKKLDIIANFVQKQPEQNELLPLFEAKKSEIELKLIRKEIGDYYNNQIELENPDKINLAKEIVKNLHKPRFKLEIIDEKTELYVKDPNETWIDEFKVKSGSYYGNYPMNIKHAYQNIIEFFEKNPDILNDETKREAFFKALDIFCLHETTPAKIMNILEDYIKS